MQTAQTTFSDFPFKDIKDDIPVCQEGHEGHEGHECHECHEYKVLKGPNMCYIFEMQGVQGYQIWHSRVL